MSERDKAAVPPAGKPKASPYNRRSIPQGIADLTSVPAFRPIKNDRDRDGKWIIRYFLFDDAAAGDFARKNVLSGGWRDLGLIASSARIRRSRSSSSGTSTAR